MILNIERRSGRLKAVRICARRSSASSRLVDMLAELKPRNCGGYGGAIAEAELSLWEYLLIGTDPSGVAASFRSHFSMARRVRSC